MAGPIFVLSSGRCGSTLIQRILNTYDDINIWGEHGGFLNHLAEAYYWLLNRPGNDEFLFAGSVRAAAKGGPLSYAHLLEKKKAESWQAWLNWFGREDVADLFRQQLLAFFNPPGLLPAGTVWGFKEIRYGDRDRVIPFLADLFPDALFVFVVRNGFDTVTSQMRAWGWNTNWFSWLDRHFLGVDAMRRAREWVTRYRSFDQWHRSGRLHSYWIAMEDVVSGKPVLAALLARLGKEYGPAQEEVVKLVEGRGATVLPDRQPPRSKRNLGYLPRLFVQLILGPLNASFGYPPAPGVGWLNRLLLRLRPASPSAAGGPAAAASPRSLDSSHSGGDNG